MSPDRIAAGQTWVPLPHTGPGGSPIRILCRYPFPTHEGQTFWIVEHMEYVQKLERLSTETLLAGWHLAES